MAKDETKTVLFIDKARIKYYYTNGTTVHIIWDDGTEYSCSLYASEEAQAIVKMLSSYYDQADYR